MTPTTPQDSEQGQVQSKVVGCVKAAIIVTDLSGKIVYWNPFAEELYGWAAEEVMGRDIMEITVSADVADQARQNMAILAAGKGWSGEFQVRRRDGRSFKALVSLSPMTDESGDITGIIGVSQDLTAHLKTQEEDHQSEEEFRAFANSLPDLAWMAHGDGHIFWYNNRWYEFTGATQEQMTGWGWQSVHDQELLPSVLERWQTSIRTGQRFEMEFPLRSATGEFKWFLTRVRPVRDDEGTVIRWVGTNTDIHKQRQDRQSLHETRQNLEKVVQERTADLKAANESLRHLSARLLQIQDEERRRIARELHDSVGQMIAAVRMDLALVETESQNLSPRAAKALSQNASMVDELSKEVRTISYLLHPPLLDEVGLVSALSFYLEGFSERSKIKVSLDTPPDLVHLSDEMGIAIFRIVQECLTNIHRHSGSGTASVRLLELDGLIRVEIQDQGKGIPLEKQHVLSSSHRGGVGLRGMRERLRQLGGSLEIQSDVDGTSVTATLPLDSSASSGPASSNI